jgi:dynein heavy chain
MIYIDASELGWNCYTESWVSKKFQDDEETKQFFKDLFEKWVPKSLKFKEANCNEPVKVADFSAVVSLCSLYNSMEKAEPTFNKDKLGTDFNSIAEKVFLFCLVWSVGGAVDESGRKKFSAALGDIDSLFPPAGTIYDYYVDIAKNEFLPWESKVIFA